MTDEVENNKINNYIYNSDNEYNDEENENELTNLENELLDNEYFDETVYTVYKNLFNFINEKSLPLCEYLDIKTLEEFINKKCN